MQKGDYSSRAQAEKYSKTRFTGGLSLVHKDEIGLLNLWLERINHSRVYLDLGTGTGRIVAGILKHKPKTIYALDSSEAMLAYLKKLYAEKVQSGVVKPLVAPSDKIPLPEKSVDVVTAFHLLKHLQDIRPTLREVHRVLRKDGYLIFDILNKNSLVRFNTGTCYVLSEKELKELLGGADLVVKDTRFLHNFGETPYKLAGPAAKLIHILDGILTRIGAKTGTKTFVLAQKV